MTVKSEFKNDKKVTATEDYYIFSMQPTSLSQPTAPKLKDGSVSAMNNQDTSGNIPVYPQGCIA